MDYTELNVIIIKDFIKTYRDFVYLGSLAYKQSPQDLIKDFFTYKDLQNIVISMSDYHKFIKNLFGETSKDTSYILTYEDNFKVSLKIFESILEKHMSKLTTKQYFEVLPWTYTYAKINVKYYVAQKIANILFSELSSESELQNLIPKNHIFNKYKSKFNVKDQKQFLSDFLGLQQTKNFLGYIQDYKLDFSGSGQLLIAMLIDDKEFLDFSGVHKIDKNAIGGYDKVLKIFEERYFKDTEYLSINKLLDLIKNPILSEGVKNLIFSRSSVKNNLMVKGYSGTIYGSASKIEKRIADYLQFNAYNIFYGNLNLVKQISKTSHKIAVELNKIIEELCPAISKRYLKLMQKFVEDIKKTKEKDNGIIIMNPIVTFVINPKKNAVIQVKLNRINPKTNKFERASRRKISHYTPNTDFRKIKSSLGADIIQSFDAVVAYYIKRICKMLNPNLHIATIFDAFIFSQHMDINTFKNVCRLACQLSMKQQFVSDMLQVNSIPIDDFYKSFNKNIFEPIKNNILEKIVESNFMYYLLKSQNEWFIEIVNPEKKLYINKSFFIKSLKFLNDTERVKYNDYINSILQKSLIYNINKYYTIFGKTVSNSEKEPDIKILKKIKELEETYKVRFILLELIKNLHILYENFYIKDAKTIIYNLRQIMNNDDFIK